MGDILLSQIACPSSPRPLLEGNLCVRARLFLCLPSSSQAPTGASWTEVSLPSWAWTLSHSIHPSMLTLSTDSSSPVSVRELSLSPFVSLVVTMKRSTVLTLTWFLAIHS